MKTRGIMTVAVVLTMFLATSVSCKENEAKQQEKKEESKVQEQVVASSQARVTNPDAAPENIGKLVKGNNGFAWALYQELKDREKGNLFFSPFSISEALAMAFGGARGETEQQMAATLGFDLPQDKLHPAFNALDQDLNSRGKDTGGGDQNAFRLIIANAIWGQNGYNFKQDFLDLLAQNYGSGLRLMDFKADPESGRAVINDWVQKTTQDKIKNLIPQGALKRDTRLVLTNAVYFKAQWERMFEKEATADGPFYLANGSQATASMMDQTEKFPYFAGHGFQAAELPYQGRTISMVIVLPDKGRFQDVEAMLNADSLDAAVQGLNYARLHLVMPKFRINQGFAAKKILSAMGMPQAFDPKTADFSGMDGTMDLVIDEVLHKAFVAVDEEGTEAAAATAVITMEATSMRPQEPPLEFIVDHPFIFFIRDTKTGAILFIGRVMNPGSGAGGEESLEPLSIEYSYSAEADYQDIKVEQGKLIYSFFDDVDDKCATWVAQTPCWDKNDIQTQEAKLSDEDINNLINFIDSVKFMNLKDVYGGAGADQRYYPYTLRVRMGENEKKVTYQSFPGGDPMPEVFTKVRGKLFDLAAGKFSSQ